MSTAATHAQIVKTPGVCGGRARIDGHRIRVQDIIIEYEWQGLSPEEICREHPGLSLAQVHSALAYYFDHRDEIRAEILEDEALAANLKGQQGNAPQGSDSAQK
jgi:uncharacterized protein (DUF433 family)